MKISREIISMCESDTKPAKAVNYFVSGLVYFKDDTVLSKTPKPQKVKAVDPKEAEKLYREMIHKNWDKGENGVNKIDIVSITKGTDKKNQHVKTEPDHPLTVRK